MYSNYVSLAVGAQERRESIVVLAHILIGTIAGLISFVAAMAQGATFWSALLVYSAVGASATLLTAVMQFALGRSGAGEAAELTATTGFGAMPIEVTAETAPEEAGPRTMRILAVDDDPFILELVPKIAGMVGCDNITVATSGPEALDIIAKAEAPFDCLLLDINMPKMDGIELCSRIRKLDDYQDTSIIMLTAMTDLDHLDRAFRAGASDYTTKPFDIIEFGDRLKTAQKRTDDNWARAHLPEANNVEPDADNDWGSGRIAALASVPAMIGYSALQNYLTRLSGPALADAFVMGINVDQTQAPADDTQPVVPLRTLILLARAIDEVFKPSKYMMAYAGNGQFVLVSGGQSLPRAAAIEGAIQENLARKSGNIKLDGAISVGTAVRPTGGRMRRARIAFESALNNADMRAAGKRGEYQSPLRQQLGA